MPRPVTSPWAITTLRVRRLKAVGVRPARQFGAVRVQVEPDRRGRAGGQRRDQAPGRFAVGCHERPDHRGRGGVAPRGGVAGDALAGRAAGLRDDDPVREGGQAGEDVPAVRTERGPVQVKDGGQVRLGGGADPVAVTT